MGFRVSTRSIFTRALLGMRTNQSRLIQAQEQLSSGRRVLRPSDDPVGSTRILSLSSQLSDVSRYRSAIDSSSAFINTSAETIQSGSDMMANARSLLLQGMNGTLSASDREALAIEFELLRDQFLELGNQRFGDRFLFAGTKTDAPPWKEVITGGRKRVVYVGNEETQSVSVGQAVNVQLNLTGPEVFGRIAGTGPVFSGLTGIGLGSTASQGLGYEYLELRHDSTDAGNLASVGVSLVGGGSLDTILGANDIVIDDVAGTIRLGSGPALTIPAGNDPASEDFVIKNELGAELHLDLRTYNGAAYTGVVTGEGSASLDGTNFVSIDFSETDLRLVNEESGTVLHVDTTAVRRAGVELTTFAGTINVFDTMQAISEDLRNADGLDVEATLERLSLHLDELSRNHDNLLVALGDAGSRGQRLISAGIRTNEADVRLSSLLADTQDADIAEVALNLTSSELIFQTSQAAGARLIQQSLLNFLR